MDHPLHQDFSKTRNLCEKCKSLFQYPWIAKTDADGSTDPNHASSTLQKSSEQVPSPSSPDADFEILQDFDSDDEDFYERADWVQLLRLSKNSQPSEYTTPQHHSWRELQKHAKSMCHLCTLLWDNAQDVVKDRNIAINELERAVGAVCIRPDLSDEDDSSKLELDVSYFRDGYHESSNAYLFTISLALWPKRILFPDLWLPTPPNAQHWSRDSTQVIAEFLVEYLVAWANECFEEHEDCKIVKKHDYAGQLPTRLIDLEPFGQSNWLAICSTCNLDKTDASLRYVTLSHRWGDTQPPLRLLRENFTEFADGILIDDLPKTFRDAVLVTRQLKVRYLWIDSLCIIQDSDSDWNNEAGRMATIYSEAYINLAATSSSDSQGGLLFPRNPLLSSPCAVDCVLFDQPAQDYVVLDESARARRVDGGPLNSRAWVMQERLLAPRTVHFAYDQVWWECTSLVANETFPGGLPYRHTLTDDMNPTTLPVYRPRANFPAQNEDWLGIVQSYTDCGLTYPSDKLIALAGVAEVVAQALGTTPDAYVAGLWMRDLLPDLLWRMRASGARYPDFVAPSWSWASVRGSVHFNSRDATAEIRANLAIRLVDAAVSLAGGNAYGSVAGGSLTVDGGLQSITLCNVDTTDEDWPRFLALQVGDATLASDFFDESLDDERLYFDAAESGSAPEVTFLRFMTTSEPHLLGRYMSEGLILQPTGVVGGEYRRVGWLRVFHSEREPDFFLQSLDRRTSAYLGGYYEQRRLKLV